MVPVLLLLLLRLLLPSWKQDVGTRTIAACLSVQSDHHLLSAASRSALRGVRSRVRVSACTDTICMCAASCSATDTCALPRAHTADFVSAASSACEIYRVHFNLVGNRTTKPAFHGVLPHRVRRIHRLFPCFFPFLSPFSYQQQTPFAFTITYVQLDRCNQCPPLCPLFRFICDKKPAACFSQRGHRQHQALVDVHQLVYGLFT